MLNGYEKFLVASGLKHVQESMKKEIADIEAAGRMPIMTAGYVDILLTELAAKLNIDFKTAVKGLNNLEEDDSDEE